ncbi:MAG: hypothetical protein IJW46_01460, partial [Clostridia bacterium]|nr:hypothetical protein [Clostridia bacterium]
MKKTYRLLALLFAAVLLVGLLASCDLVEEYAESEEVTTVMERVLSGERFYGGIFQGYPSGSVDAVWDELERIFEGASSYEVAFTAVKTSINNGKETLVAVYEVTADTDATAQFTLTYDETAKLIGFHVLDITPKTDAVTMIMKVVFILLSLASIAFSIWMIIDCAKRPIAKKALWIILILLSYAITVTVGEKLDFNSSLGIFLTFNTYVATASYTTVKIVIPFGTIVYFILRKRLKPANHTPNGTPPYGQPPYGQVPNGTPPYGQPPYGQVPNGTPPYGQPPYGQ